MKQIEVASTTIHIKLNNSALRRKLALAEADALPDPEIKLTGQFIRCGKQVRLVIGKEDETTARVDERLVREIIRAQKWFEDLVSGHDASISALAKRHDCSAPYVSRKISLAFLAPDILQAILDGTQPTSITPERLKKTCPLPSDWREQRVVLLQANR